MNIQRKRFEDAARRYADADRSDPFAFARAMTHIDNGIVSVTGAGQDAAYDAVEARETRILPDGMSFSNGDREWQAKVYRNITRP